jgi:hypothetical protein
MVDNPKRSSAIDITQINESNIWVGSQCGALNLVKMIADQKPIANYPLSGWGILNVAWDLDIDYSSCCYKQSTNKFNDLVAEHHKIGLVDGPGNLPTSLAAAVLMVRQLNSARQYLCPKDTPARDENAYGRIDQILVHCHSGHSRSVTVAAVYLYYMGVYDSIQKAVCAVAHERKLSNVERQTEYLISLAENEQTQGLIELGWDSSYLKPGRPCKER